MIVDNVGVKQHIGVIGDLVGVVIDEAVIGVYFVVGNLLLQTYTSILAVEVIAAFGKSLVTLGVDADAKEVIAFIETVLRVEVHLTAKAVLLQGFDAQFTTETPGMRMVITQKDIVLCGHRVIHKRIVVAVHLHVVVTHMAEEHDAILFSHFGSNVEVEIRHGHCVAIQVEEHLFALVFQRLLIVHVDLSGDGLVTVSDRRSSFGYLDAVHPIAGHIVQAKSRGQTTEIGDDFGHHLGVDAAQAEQLDLFGTRDGITVIHIH